LTRGVQKLTSCGILVVFYQKCCKEKVVVHFRGTNQLFPEQRWVFVQIRPRFCKSVDVLSLQACYQVILAEMVVCFIFFQNSATGGNHWVPKEAKREFRIKQFAVI
jgi:hypothetical protein